MHSTSTSIHIEYTVAEETEGCFIVATVVPTRVEGVGG
jgi:hypothetical protein